MTNASPLCLLPLHHGSMKRQSNSSTSFQEPTSTAPPAQNHQSFLHRSRERERHRGKMSDQEPERRLLTVDHPQHISKNQISRNPRVNHPSLSATNISTFSNLPPTSTPVLRCCLSDPIDSSVTSK
ncbi:unnamed protein product [Ilex paraguariensis]|uniref:Uncharacterized protein n=1 Tax=Ilex paraguariensis TaxID=185542 RepID=A0ABC8R9F4_9AQUA